MADDIKIVPDPAPAEPFDVKVIPDPPPRDPIDVSVSPDPAPWVPHDVPLVQDTGPWKPVDVTVTLDTPPTNPVDVAIFPDSAPWKPVDVVTTPDSLPVDPFNVVTTPDEPPADPFDVSIVFDPPPFDPKPGSRDHRDIDLGIQLDPPPFDPLSGRRDHRDDRNHRTDLGIELDPLPSDAGRSIGGPPTIQSIINSVGALDKTLANFLDTLIVGPTSFTGRPPAGALDPTVLAKWFKDYVSGVGIHGMTQFLAEQAVLYSMNPVVARVFDPGYFALMLIPGSMGHAHTTIDTQAGRTADIVALERDKIDTDKIHGDIRQKINGTPFDENVYNKSHDYVAGQNFSVDGMIESVFDGNSSYQFLKDDGIGNQKRRVYDASQYFDSPDSHGAQKLLARARAVGAENIMASSHARANALDGIIRASIPGEEEDGSVLSPTQDPSVKVLDDDTRVPISFTDLRKDPIKNSYRSVYFRPLNLQFSTAFSPEYNESSALGRVDSVVGYIKTSRTINLSFDLHAFAPEDLKVMYNKMVWLQSMVYPSFGADSVLRSGPVVRLRIGDAISTELGGVAGVIKSLNFDFADAIWEIEKDRKVPRSFKVTVDFMVLHDGPIGILNGVFGVFNLPPGGPPANKDTSNGGSQDSQDQVPEIATIQPGMFSKFGEPRR